MHSGTSVTQHDYKPFRIILPNITALHSPPGATKILSQEELLWSPLSINTYLCLEAQGLMDRRSTQMQGRAKGLHYSQQKCSQLDCGSYFKQWFNALTRTREVDNLSH